MLKRALEETLFEKSSKNLLDAIEEKSDEESSRTHTNESHAEEQKFINKLRKIYSRDKILQKIIKINANDNRRISLDLIRKKDLRIKLRNYRIEIELLWINNRWYVSKKETLYTRIIKKIHESSSKEHFDRVITYDRLNRYYYWSRMIYIVTRYIKSCHMCKRIKVYRKKKHELLKFLLILKIYFPNISMNFIVELLVCNRYDRFYRAIMIIFDRLFKKRKFIIMNSLRINTMIQVFIEWVWKKERLFYNYNIRSRLTIYKSFLTKIMRTYRH